MPLIMHWTKCHRKSTTISEVSISGVRSVVPNPPLLPYICSIIIVSIVAIVIITSSSSSSSSRSSSSSSSNCMTPSLLPLHRVAGSRALAGFQTGSGETGFSRKHIKQCVCIYIYMQRERERARERNKTSTLLLS